jgi:hypothetical protein
MNKESLRRIGLSVRRALSFYLPFLLAKCPHKWECYDSQLEATAMKALITGVALLLASQTQALDVSTATKNNASKVIDAPRSTGNGCSWYVLNKYGKLEVCPTSGSIWIPGVKTEVDGNMCTVYFIYSLSTPNDPLTSQPQCDEDVTVSEKQLRQVFSEIIAQIASHSALGKGRK